jgi:hypothetical protein
MIDETTETKAEETTDSLAPTTPCPFKIGDVVCLKSSCNLPMTVEGHFTHQASPDWVIAVVWFDVNWQLHRTQIEAGLLTAY